MWELIQQYIVQNPEPTVITAKVVKSKVQDLKKQIEVQLPVGGQKGAKRPASDMPVGQRAKAPLLTLSPPAGPTSEDIMAELLISPEDRQKYVSRYVKATMR